MKKGKVVYFIILTTVILLTFTSCLNVKPISVSVNTSAFSINGIVPVKTPVDVKWTVKGLDDFTSKLVVTFNDSVVFEKSGANMTTATIPEDKLIKTGTYKYYVEVTYDKKSIKTDEMIFKVVPSIKEIRVVGGGLIPAGNSKLIKWDTFSYVEDRNYEYSVMVLEPGKKEYTEVATTTNDYYELPTISTAGEYKVKVVAKELDDIKVESPEVSFYVVSDSESFISTKFVEYSSTTPWYIEKIPAEISKQATDILLKFFKYSEEDIDNTTETISERSKLNLIDIDKDGIYDQWKEVSTYTEHDWIQIPYKLFEYETLWIVDKIVYKEDAIFIKYAGAAGKYAGYGIDIPLATVGFDLNTYYSVYMLTVNYKAKDYRQFILEERYDSDTKPVFKLKSDASKVATGSEFKVTINATNVAEFAKSNDVRYMQLAVKYSKYLTLENVEFPDFIDSDNGYADFSAYKVSDSATSVILYKGFTLDTDETEPASENFAVLTFKVSNDATGTLKINLAYEGYLDDYDTYIDVPNPIFKDKDNVNVDGFIVDHTDLSVTVSGGDEE
ncbi:cohesin domain-containing protein [Marinitoga sp. 1135]|uniref:cohesin domain-containing protein n=1 Tax=Marinitoga sp. 1135 TaxID=1643333 RepID=UPI001586199B|nr:cohesin domain-containing protein [Marinitoga sp. 1135]